MDLKSEAGFTMMEVLLALALFGILSITIGTLLANTINNNKRLTEKSMKLEDGRIAMDFIETHIKAADEITITEHDLITKQLSPASNRTFHFNPLTSKLEFGGNELAREVERFSLSRSGDLVKIEIVMKPGTGYDKLQLIGQVNVKYKVVN
jgi:prepilin-type N-terminal cleavage/methylation domain-containing protein